MIKWYLLKFFLEIQKKKYILEYSHFGMQEHTTTHRIKNQNRRVKRAAWRHRITITKIISIEASEKIFFLQEPDTDDIARYKTTTNRSGVRFGGHHRLLNDGYLRHNSISAHPYFEPITDVTTLMAQKSHQMDTVPQVFGRR